MLNDPKIEIQCQKFITGTWWWASVQFTEVYVTSGYWRKRDVAVRKLKAKLRRLDFELEFAKGFLRCWRR